MPHDLKPEKVDTWFPPEFQKRYTNHLIGKSGLTPTQARHFVRLWGYGHARHCSDEHIPIQILKRKIGGFLCSQGDACKLFYADENKGTPRSAGLMMNKFETKQLVKRETFNGATTLVTLRIPSEFDLPVGSQQDDVFIDAFDRRNDIPIVAHFLEELYSYDGNRPADIKFNIQKGLRYWTRQYPAGVRVLRQSAKKQPIGFTSILPVHPDSARDFCLPPKGSRSLSRFVSAAADPIQMAEPNDEDCYIAYIRSWQLHPKLWTHENAQKLLEETQAILRRMHQEYPGLTDIYSINIHPRLEEFAFALGFQPMTADGDSPLRWIYMSLDRFLELDSEDVLLDFDFKRWQIV
ncbi:MAG: hypothetical protein AAF959_19180 [Cyanobacteria bacterium P01_D01_bin.56]